MFGGLRFYSYLCTQEILIIKTKQITMMKKLIFMLIVAFACAGTADAQGWLKKLGKVAEDAAKRTVESNVDRKTSQAVDDAMNPDADRKSSKKSSSSDGDASYDEEEVEPQEENATYEQTDFVPGAVAFFEDNLQNEQMGEFPSKWDLIEGSTDVAIMKGKKCIHFEPGTRIEPLMTNQQSYIPDVFTLEFDFWMNDPKTEMSNCYELEFKDADGGDVYEIRIGESYSKLEVTCRFMSTTGDWRDSGGGKTWEMKKNDWSHFAISFNKRALKIYVNNKRVINIPNCKSAVRMKIHQAEWGVRDEQHPL